MKTVLKSQTAGFRDFAAEVLAHSAETKAWVAHMARVKEDDDNQVVDPLKKHAPYPKPYAAALIQECLNDDGEPDYVVENDDPPPELVLARKKAALSELVIAAHSAATERILPVGKRLLLSLKVKDVAAMDAKRRAAANPDVPCDVAALRTPDEAAIVAQNDSVQAGFEAAHRAMAEMLSDVEDLTLDNIDGWKIPAFPS